MLETLVRSSARRPLLVVLLTLAAAAIGAATFSDLPRDVFPDLSAPVFNIIVQNASMGPEELETAIAIPLENALAGLPGARRVRSSSQLGVAQVTVELEPDADYYLGRQLVAERVAQVASSLPPGSEPPLLSSLTGRLNEVMELTLEAAPGAADPMTLRDLAELEIRNRLLAVPGIAAVERLGGYLREVQVQLDPERMSARGVTLSEVQHAVETASANAAAGFVVQGSIEWSVRAVGRAERPEDLASTVVAMRGDVPVLLGDVAEVRDAPAIRRGLAHRLEGEVVSLRVVRQFGADTAEVSEGVHAALAELRPTLPEGVSLEVAYDQAELVDEALSGVGRAVLIGALLVVLVLFVLLGDARGAFVVTLTLPLSIAIAGLVLPWLGVGLNTMTLGGLAIAVGLLVDASIIVVENVMHRTEGLARGPELRARAIDAAAEVARPIAFATLIVVAVFLPLFAMQGIEGRMYAPLAAAVIASLGASLALALTFTPVLASIVLRPSASAGSEVGVVRALRRAYEPLLAWAMRHAWLVRITALLVTVPAVVIAMRIGGDLMPRLDEGALLIQTVLPTEASLEEVDLLNHRVEDALREFPEVDDVVRRTGRSERTEDPMPHTISDVLVVLRPDRARSGQQLADAMRVRLERVPGVTALFTTPLGMRIDEGLGGTPADIAVRIFGPDSARLATFAEQAREIVERVPGTADVRAERASSLPQIRIEVDRAAAARVGLTPGDVVEAVRIGMVGDVAGELWRGPRRVDVLLRLQDAHRGDLAAIRGLLLDGHDGTRIPLGQVARIEQTLGPAAIRREAGSRRVAVESSVSGRDLASTAAEIRAALFEQLELPTGYFFDVGGRVETQARATRSLALAIAVAIAAVLVLLYIALGSLEETLVILATLPDAFVGGILALWISGETWNVSSLVGLIGLFGIAVQNGLVLVTQTRGLVAEGLPFEAALERASLGRLRPKVMTAATAMLGLLPILVLPLRGTEIERPLAIVMIGGLATSTLFTLLALPTFYALVERLRQRRASAR
ncbi:Cobalt-zinc-cadmium resistance protein CzcA [Sandaracinus amylolyticus]|uniref:Cobalt-zinc-cadmium resistance protein CzcA n=1 Tax=Sandaracinus amylolyticus TaxID=927083 RepID=A0A0F6W0M7_9BACT|nr:efflux RND transporter permease subunit [Sandaracinus amylolyticus]AKF04475.1 Cobalt-zinc-cadmium resistance protein CzcA [Sandaracinus amylolyticus]